MLPINLAPDPINGLRVRDEHDPAREDRPREHPPIEKPPAQHGEGRHRDPDEDGRPRHTVRGDEEDHEQRHGFKRDRGGDHPEDRPHADGGIEVIGIDDQRQGHQMAVTSATPSQGMDSAACWIGPDCRLKAITNDAATSTMSPAARSNFRSEARIPRRPAATVAPGTFWAIIRASLHAAHANAPVVAGIPNAVIRLRRWSRPGC